MDLGIIGMASGGAARGRGKDWSSIGGVWQLIRRRCRPPVQSAPRARESGSGPPKVGTAKLFGLLCQVNRMPPCGRNW